MAHTNHTQRLARTEEALTVLFCLIDDAYHWLTSSEYAALRHRLEDAHAAVEAALVEARRRARLNEGRDKPQGL